MDEEEVHEEIQEEQVIDPSPRELVCDTDFIYLEGLDDEDSHEADTEHSDNE